jgi:purine-binding chemotaxis protein CheW
VAEQSSTEVQLVVFELHGERFGAEIARVHEIIRPPEITRVPRAPEFVEGVINLRGRIVPVVNLRRRFGFEEEEATRATRIVVMDVASTTIGMVVDAVTEVARISLASIEPPGPIVSSLNNEFLRGIVKRADDLIVLLDIDRVLDDKARLQTADLAAA